MIATFALTNLMKRGAILAILPPLSEGQAEQLRQKKSLCQNNIKPKIEHETRIASRVF
jgi:hypothetical protein